MADCLHFTRVPAAELPTKTAWIRRSKRTNVIVMVTGRNGVPPGATFIKGTHSFVNRIGALAGDGSLVTGDRRYVLMERC